MSTRKSFNSIVHSLIHLLVASLVVAMGLLCAIVPYSERFRGWVYDAPKMVLMIGISIIAFGLSLFIGFFFMHRKRYIQFKIGSPKAAIQENIVYEYVHRYWEGLFPGEKFDLEVRINGHQRIEIITSLREITEASLVQIQNELGILLARRLGYEKELTLTLSIPS